ncbi:uncharacterized protein PG986_002377 [Apiospora aurea]|uniref:Uncharacterized protein n=1 Tax=Apiospora aurea TaxID=335848 RepID=A0ABR1R1C5_9PEZI
MYASDESRLLPPTSDTRTSPAHDFRLSISPSALGLLSLRQEGTPGAAAPVLLAILLAILPPPSRSSPTIPPQAHLENFPGSRTNAYAVTSRFLARNINTKLSRCSSRACESNAWIGGR